MVAPRNTAPRCQGAGIDHRRLTWAAPSRTPDARQSIWAATIATANLPAAEPAIFYGHEPRPMAGFSNSILKKRLNFLHHPISPGKSCNDSPRTTRRPMQIAGSAKATPDSARSRTTAPKRSSTSGTLFGPGLWIGAFGFWLSTFIAKYGLPLIAWNGRNSTSPEQISSSEHLAFSDMTGAHAIQDTKSAAA